MTSESATSPVIPPPQEQHSDPRPPLLSPLKSEPIFAQPPSPPKATMEDVVNSNEIVTDKLINEIEEPVYFKYLDSEEYAEKYRRYEEDFKEYLVAKHFSGVDTFEERTDIDGETIMSSKWPWLRLYVDPDISYVDEVQCLVEEEQALEEVEEELVQEVEEEEEEEDESVDSASAEISPGEISNGGSGGCFPTTRLTSDGSKS